jgi:hypothetical protein
LKTDITVPTASTQFRQRSANRGIARDAQQVSFDRVGELRPQVDAPEPLRALVGFDHRHVLVDDERGPRRAPHELRGFLVREGAARLARDHRQAVRHEPRLRQDIVPRPALDLERVEDRREPCPRRVAPAELVGLERRRGKPGARRQFITRQPELPPRREEPAAPFVHAHNHTRGVVCRHQVARGAHVLQGPILVRLIGSATIED